MSLWMRHCFEAMTQTLQIRRPSGCGDMYKTCTRSNEPKVPVCYVVLHVAQDLLPIDNLRIDSQFLGMWPKVGYPYFPGWPYTYAYTGSTN